MFSQSRSALAWAAMAVGMAAISLPRASANPLVYEGFDVPGATTGQQWSSTTGAGSTSTGFAAGSVWQGVVSSGAYPTTAADYTFGQNISVPGLASAGGSIQMNASSGAYYVAKFARQLGSSLPGTIWGSYEVTLGSDSAGAFNAVGLDFTSSPANTNNKSILGSFLQMYNSGGYGGSSSNLGGLQLPGALTYINQGSAVAPGSAANYVVIYTFSGIGSATANVSGNEWVLTSSQYANLAGQPGGITDAALNGATLGTATGDVLERAFTSDATALDNTASITGSDYLQLYTLGGSSSFDEIRIGTTLADVTPTVAVPEPSVLLLLGMCVVARGLWASRFRGAARPRVA